MAELANFVVTTVKKRPESQFSIARMYLRVDSKSTFILISQSSNQQVSTFPLASVISSTEDNDFYKGYFLIFKFKVPFAIPALLSFGNLAFISITIIITMAI